MSKEGVANSNTPPQLQMGTAKLLLPENTQVTNLSKEGDNSLTEVCDIVNALHLK